MALFKKISSPKSKTGTTKFLLGGGYQPNTNGLIGTNTIPTIKTPSVNLGLSVKPLSPYSKTKNVPKIAGSGYTTSGLKGYTPSVITSNTAKDTVNEINNLLDSKYNVSKETPYSMSGINLLGSKTQNKNKNTGTIKETTPINTKTQTETNPVLNTKESNIQLDSPIDRYTEMTNNYINNLDDMFTQHQETIQNIMKTGELNQQQQGMLNAVNANFEEAKRLQNIANKSDAAIADQFGLRLGLNKQSPIQSQGYIQDAIYRGTNKINNINSLQAETISKLYTAFEEENFTMAEKLYTDYTNYEKDKSSAITDLWKTTNDYNNDLRDYAFDVKKEENDMYLAFVDNDRQERIFQEQIAQNILDNQYRNRVFNNDIEKEKFDTYFIREGENLRKVAEKLNLPYEAIKNANPELNELVIPAGTKIKIPKESFKSESNDLGKLSKIDYNKGLNFLLTDKNATEEDVALFESGDRGFQAKILELANK